MEKQLKRYGFCLGVLFSFYTIISYLIFLRDDFLLERIAYLTNAPWLLETGRHLAKLLHVNSIPTPIFFLTVTAMFVIYVKTLRLLRNQTSGRSVKSKQSAATNIVLRYAAVFLITTFFSFPALSTDVFDYISSNRVLFVHHANPWIEPPQNFPEDPLIYLGSWKFRASVYGPVQFIFSSLVQGIAKDDIVNNIIGFKMEGLIFTLGLIWLMKKWLKEYDPENLEFGLTLFVWNPLILIEIVGNAHNDMVMAFFTFLGFYWFSKKRLSFAALAVAFGVLSKMVAVLFVPLMVLWLILRKQRNDAVRFFISVVLFITLGFASLGKGFMAFMENLGVQLGLYLRSLPTIIRFGFLRLGFTELCALAAEKILTVPPFVLLYGILISKMKQTGLLSAIITASLIYFMLVSPMLQPWYLVWFFPFVAILSKSFQRLQNVAIVFSYSSLCYYGVLFSSYYFYPLHFFWQIAMFGTIVVPPLFLWLMPKRWYTQGVEKYLVS